MSYDAGSSDQVLFDNLEGEMELGEERSRAAGTYVYLWLILVNVWSRFLYENILYKDL